jgi:MFS family permease
METNKGAAALDHGRARRNVWLLSASHAVKLSQSALIFAVTGLLGAEIAPTPALATLPVALQFLSTMLVTIPAAIWLARYGAKACFMVAAFICVVGAAIATWAVQHSAFIPLCVGITLVGVFNGISNYYRFVAADQSPAEYKSRAISYVLGGGVLAAFLGPNLARFSRGWIDGPEFLGSFFAIFLVSLLSLPALALLKLPAIQFHTKKSGGRPFWVIARQPKFIVAVVCGILGYCTMNFLMIATPLAMKACHLSFADTASVIQWHVFAMFAPAFVTGSLIKRFGAASVMAVGAVVDLVAVGFNLSGTSLLHYTVALFLLGVGWNFLFIGATAMLTETYKFEERGKAQGANDFIVSTGVAVSAFFSGTVHARWGWEVANYIVLPWIAIILLSLAWLWVGSRQAARVAANAAPPIAPETKSQPAA